MTYKHLHHRSVDVVFNGGDMACVCVCVYTQRKKRIYQIYVKQKVCSMINNDNYRCL